MQVQKLLVRAAQKFLQRSDFLQTSHSVGDKWVESKLPFLDRFVSGGCFLPLAASVDHKTLVRLTGTIADGLLLNLKYYFLGIPVCHSHQQGRGDTERFRA
jgi:hypothetical protein